MSRGEGIEEGGGLSRVGGSEQVEAEGAEQGLGLLSRGLGG